MTLIIGVIAKDGIVLASDSRMTSSDITSNEAVQKIFKLDDKNVVGISGDGTLGMHFLNLIKDKLDLGTGIVDLVEQIRKLGKENFQDYYSHITPQDRPGLTFLIAGYAKNSGEALLYELKSMDNFIPRPSPTGYASIGVPYIADYLMGRFYQNEIDTNQAKVLATFCIMETASQAHGVNDNIKISALSKSNSYSELTSLQVENIKKRCAGYHVLNKNKFYPEDSSDIDSAEK